MNCERKQDILITDNHSKRAGIRENVIFAASVVGRLLLCPGDDIAVVIAAGSSANQQITRGGEEIVLPKREIELEVEYKNGQKERVPLV